MRISVGMAVAFVYVATFASAGAVIGGGRLDPGVGPASGVRLIRLEPGASSLRMTLAPGGRIPSVFGEKTDKPSPVLFAGRCGSSSYYCNETGATYCCGNETDGFYCAADVNGC